MMTPETKDNKQLIERFYDLTTARKTSLRLASYYATM
jgi:hypothetical protein